MCLIGLVFAISIMIFALSLRIAERYSLLYIKESCHLVSQGYGEGVSWQSGEVRECALANYYYDDDGRLWGFLPQDYLRQDDRCNIGGVGHFHRIADGGRAHKHSKHGPKLKTRIDRAKPPLNKKKPKISRSLRYHPFLPQIPH